MFGHNDQHDDSTKHKAAGAAMAAAPSFIAGALLGAGVALLLAPARGDETRDVIGRKLNRLGRDAKHRLDDAGDKMTEKAESLAQGAREAVGQVGDAIRNRPAANATGTGATTGTGNTQRPA